MVGEVARAAGMETVAEYVHSAAALALLAKYGIDYAQGYFIGRAAPKPQQVEFLRHAQCVSRCPRAFRSSRRRAVEARAGDAIVSNVALVFSFTGGRATDQRVAFA